MKSPMNRLLSRGLLRPEDVERYSGSATPDLLRILESGDAVERSAAVRPLAMKPPTEGAILRIFVTQLTRETKLYTKLEFCAALRAGGVESARLLIPLLSMIGSNQYSQPASVAFKKSSYPLPRDIVARIFARMDAQILPMLVAVVRFGPRHQAVEAIDAIGLMCFYSSVEPRDRISTLHELIKSFHSNSSDDLLRWKIVRALESFHHANCLHLLAKILGGDAELPLHHEARRSLAIVVTQPLIGTLS